MAKRVLFILKYRHSYGPYGDYCDYNDYGEYSCGYGLSSGILNSVRFVVEMLEAAGVEAKLVQVVDNNGIDKEVHDYQPDIAIIEAVWVVPDKFEVLQQLHPDVQWVVRIHSDLPFLAQEGMAVGWLCNYAKFANVSIASNDRVTTEQFRNIVAIGNPELSEEEVEDKVLYLPNYYPIHPPDSGSPEDDGYVNVGCFGAIRPMKNQLLQAAAALEFAQIQDKVLRFHINVGRCESGGDNVLKNIRGLFANVAPHQLVEHSWMSHTDFRQLLTTLDVGLQVSYSETFNIVAADYVSSGLPIVVSPEIHWATKFCKADPNDPEDILTKMLQVTDWRFSWFFKKLNHRGLKHYSETSRVEWLKFLL